MAIYFVGRGLQQSEGFVQAEPSPSVQAAVCWWNITTAPAVDWEGAKKTLNFPLLELLYLNTLQLCTSCAGAAAAAALIIHNFPSEF